MTYQAELDFMNHVLRKYHVQVTVLSSETESFHGLDLGLRRWFGGDRSTDPLFRNLLTSAQSNVIYKLSDPLHCHYIFLILPDTPTPTYLLIGPYVLKELTDELILETMEHWGVSAQQFIPIRKCYNNIPYLPDEDSLFTLLITFGELIWGGSEAFEVVDLAEDFTRPFTPFNPVTDVPTPQDIMLNMKLMEQRYALENELMKIVSQGLVHRAEHMLSGVSTFHFDRRMGDPIRDLKNYCIICNTLLRKAAEQGGVHPVYLDSVSAGFAQKIEYFHSPEAAHNMMRDMINSYCRLVRKYATKNYSSVIQRTITYIDSDLSADLSLHTLAAVQKVNPSYLSSLFKKETGETLTDHVNKKRMAQAAHLLQTTQLQIQSVAQSCGISDVNYFSKLFKKYSGQTPREFRSGIAERT